MKAFSYMKLDLYLIKIAFIYHPVMFAIIMGMFFFLKQPVFALNILYFFILAMASLPFIWEAYSKCRQFYYILPAKNSHMVLGRYLLVSMFYLFVLAITVISILCNIITEYGLLILCVSAIVATLLVSIQIPVFYKYGYERSQLTSVFIYIAPSFIIVLLPSVPIMLKDYERFLEIAANKSYLIGLLCIIFIFTTIFISYKISCRICSRKEIFNNL